MDKRQIEMQNNFQQPQQQQQDENYKNSDDNDEYSNIIKEINLEQIQAKNPQPLIKQNHQNKNSENKNKRLNQFQIPNIADENQDFTAGQKYFLNKQTSQIRGYFEETSKNANLIREILNARIDQNNKTINSIQQQIQNEFNQKFNTLDNNIQSINQRLEQQGNQIKTSSQDSELQFVLINKKFMILVIVSIISIIILCVCLGVYIGQLKDIQNNLETDMKKNQEELKSLETNMKKNQEELESIVLKQITSINQNLNNLQSFDSQQTFKMQELQNKSNTIQQQLGSIKQFQSKIQFFQVNQYPWTFTSKNYQSAYSVLYEAIPGLIISFKIENISLVIFLITGHYWLSKIDTNKITRGLFLINNEISIQQIDFCCSPGQFLLFSNTADSTYRPLAYTYAATLQPGNYKIQFGLQHHETTNQEITISGAKMTVIVQENINLTQQLLN